MSNILINIATAILAFTTMLEGVEEASDLKQVLLEFDAGLYQLAAPKLEVLLQLETGNQKNSLRSQLAYAYLQIGQEKKAEVLLENNLYRTDDYYLFGLACHLGHKPEKAVVNLEKYVGSSGPLRFKDHAELILGQILSKNEPKIAEGHFLSVTFDPDHPEYFVMARTEAAQIAFNEDKRQLAMERLKPIGELLPADHPLIYQYAYVRGDLLFKAGDYASAIPWLEKAVQKTNSDALYDLGLAYLQTEEKSESNLTRAEAYLQQLFSSNPTEQAALALARCLYLRGNRNKDPDLYRKAEALLAMENLYKSPEAKIHALLLQADFAPRETAQRLFEKAAQLMEGVYQKDEMAYLYGLAALRLDYGELPKIIQSGLAYAPSGKYVPSLLLLMGAYYQNLDNHEAAEEPLLQLTERFPQSKEAAEAWYRLANSSEALKKDNETIRTYRRYVYEQFPDNPLAVEAYFASYSYRDYLQGDRRAMHHLQGMMTQFPQSPLTITALYLLGLDYLRDRKTPEGRWIRKKSLTTAIDYFQQAETLFSRLDSPLPYYRDLSHRAMLERALTNYVVAEESSGPKQQIYLDYSIEAFQKLRNENSLQFELLEEAEFGLAQALVKAKRDKEAEAVLDEMLAKYRAGGHTRGYYLSRVWYELGLNEIRKGLYPKALEDFERAEEAAKGGLLSADQLLELWIAVSYSYRAMGNLDQAMLMLSKVINENVVSGLRIKAMVLRAEIYEMEGRTDLARKQLESAVKKGGEWSVKAKAKLMRIQ